MCMYNRGAALYVGDVDVDVVNIKVNNNAKK